MKSCLAKAQGATVRQIRDSVCFTNLNVKAAIISDYTILISSEQYNGSRGPLDYYQRHTPVKAKACAMQDVGGTAPSAAGKRSGIIVSS